MPPGTIYTFGDFELIIPARRLQHCGEPVPLGDRHLSVLLHLVKHAGTIASKNDLITAGWDDVAVTDNSLEQAISALRRVLGPDPHGRPYVETVARRGYRFVGTVATGVARETDHALDALLAPYRVFLEGRAALVTLERDAITRARQAFETVVTQTPDDAAAHIGLANACVLGYEMTRAARSRDVDALARAARHAREACRLDAHSAEAWATLGFVLDRTGARVDALAASRRAVTLEPATWRHQFRLADVSWGDERLRAAHRTLALLPGFPQAHWLAATVHVARQAWTEAERELLAGIVALDGQRVGAVRFNGVALHWLLGLFYWAQGDADRALAALECELAREADGHLYARECCANAWYAVGAIRMRQGDAMSAKVAFRQTLTRVPHHPLAHIGLAVLGVGPRRMGDFATNAEPSGIDAPLPMEATFAAAAHRVLQGAHVDAAQVVGAALAVAPLGNFGWLLPLEPLLRVAAQPTVWASVLTLLRARAA